MLCGTWQDAPWLVTSQGVLIILNAALLAHLFWLLLDKGLLPIMAYPLDAKCPQSTQVPLS